MKMQFKRTVAIALSLALLASSVLISGIFAVSAEADDVIYWDGVTYTKPADLDGDGVFEIDEPAELAWFVKYNGRLGEDDSFSGTTAILTKDIWLNDMTVSVVDGLPVVKKHSDPSVTIDPTAANNGLNEWFDGVDGMWFVGTLDGNGHRVNGLYIKEDEGRDGNKYGCGLIPRAGGGCTVKNIGIENSYMNTKSNWVTAFIVGSSHNAASTVDRCYVGASAYHTGICAAAIVGGDNGGATVTNCYTMATCDDTNNDGGVIIGHTWGTKGTVMNCYTTGGYNLVRRDANNNYRGTVTESYTPDSAPGANALTVMPALGAAYAITDGYPELKVFTNTDPRAWGGFISEPALDTDGTTYLVTNAEELAWALSGDHNGNTYKLTDDIYLNDVRAVNWTGDNAGTANEGYTVRSWTTKSFYGTLNGDGHIIYGLYNNKGATTGAWNWDDCRGLVNITANNLENATAITGLGMDCLYVNTNHFAGAFVGKVNGANSKVLFEKCFLGENATINAYGIGGFVGVSNGIVGITSCYSLIATENMKMHTPYQRGGFLGNCWATTVVSDSYALSCTIGHKNTIPALNADSVRYAGMATEGGNYGTNTPLTTVISADKMKGIGVLTEEGRMTGLSDAFIETTSYPILEIFKESLMTDHGVYYPLTRVIDYSEYTVIPGSGGNSWGPNNCANNYTWFSVVEDETASGGKYLKFKAPHEVTGGYPSTWLGHYGITMTPTGKYGLGGDENLVLENSTTYRVTMRMRTVELSGKPLCLYVSYGDIHHSVTGRTNILTGLGEMKEWTDLTFTFTTPETYTAGEENCFIGLTLDADSTAFEYDIDTITLEKLSALELYYKADGEYILYDTLYGIPGEEVLLPDSATAEEYDYGTPVGTVKSYSFDKWYADKLSATEAVARIANRNTAVYAANPTVTETASDNQEMFVGFDNYVDRVSGFGEGVTISDQAANSGKLSLKAEINGAATAELRNDFTFDILPEKTYKAEFFYKSTEEVKFSVGGAKGSYNGEFTEFGAVALPAAENFTKAELLFTADGAEDNSVLCVNMTADKTATVYLDTIAIYSVTESVGAEAVTTENGEGLRFMMTYSGTDTDTVFMGDKEYTVIEHGLLVKGAELDAALTLENAELSGVFAFAQKDMSKNWSVNPVSGATVYSAYLEGFDTDDTYKVSARGYIKLSDGSLFYTDVFTASVADIPEAGELIPENADLTDWYVYLPEGTVMDEATADTATVYNSLFVEDSSSIAENTLQKGAYVAFSARPDEDTISVPDELKYTLHSGTKAELYCGLDVKLVEEKLGEADEDAVNYIFITDIHYKAGADFADSLKRQVSLITEMANENEDIDFVVVGGDTTTGMFSTKEQAIAETQEILDPLMNCTKPVFVLMGNHDDNSYYYYTVGSVSADFVISDKNWNDSIIDRYCPENIVQDDEAKRANSKYYYYDLNDTTRIICLDALDYDAQYDENGDITTLPGSWSGINWWGYSADQMRWLAEDALDTDKNVIFLSHMGIDKDTNCYNNAIQFGSELRAIIAAYQSGGSYTASLSDYWGEPVNISADFTDGGKILSYQFGHMHIEGGFYSEDIDLWQISTSSANVDQTGTQTEEALMSGSANNKNLPWRVFTRRLGTEQEACFSVMSVSANRIYRYAVGVGNDEKMIIPQ